MNDHLSKLGKHYKEFKLQYKKQSVEEVLIQRVVKTTIQIFYDEGFFDAFPNADKVVQVIYFNTRRKLGKKKVNDNVQ